MVGTVICGAAANSLPAGPGLDHPSDAASALAKAEGELLGSLAAIIRAANCIAATGGDPALVTSAVAVALQDPGDVVRIATVRKEGGVWAKIVNWLLGVW
jgi:hypothetical protein